MDNLLPRSSWRSLSHSLLLRSCAHGLITTQRLGCLRGRSQEQTCILLVNLRAGSLVRGTSKFKIGKRCCKAHRVIWYLVTGEDPLDHDIDHKDQCNLVTINFQIFGRLHDLKIGLTILSGGGDFTKPLVSTRLTSTTNGKHLHLGLFLTPAEAQAAYREKAVELRGEFAPQAWRQGSA